METPKDQNGEAENGSAPPKKDEPSYEDNWYQVMKRRSEEPAEDDESDEKSEDS